VTQAVDVETLSIVTRCVFPRIDPLNSDPLLCRKLHNKFRKWLFAQSLEAY